MYTGRTKVNILAFTFGAIIAICLVPSCTPYRELPCTSRLLNDQKLNVLSMSPDGSTLAVLHGNYIPPGETFSLINLKNPNDREDYDNQTSNPTIIGLYDAVWRDKQSLYVLSGGELNIWDPVTSIITYVIACADCYPGFDVSSKGAVARTRHAPDLQSVFEVLEPESFRLMWAITTSDGGLNHPVWSPNGGLLLLDDASSSYPRTHVFDVKTGGTTELPKSVASRMVYRWQPWLTDDEILLADLKDKALWRYNIRTQAESLFLRFETPYPNEKKVVGYSIDRSGQRLVVRMDGTFNLYVLDLACLAAQKAP